ncbi:MAG: periplasmic heavy metal sensor [Chlorobiaceae bacterium]|nr:periplasmic heavy metal sensor [Chlorobiaceae bacterium]
MNKILLTALLAGFIGTAGTTYAADNVQPSPCVQPGAAGPGDCRGYGTGPGARHARPFMKKALGLSESQEVKMTEMRKSFFQESSQVRQELKTLRHDLADESVRNKPDERKIADLSDRIGRQHTKLARLQSSHLRGLSTVLDHKQMETLLQMRDNMGHRGWKRG